jgi:hypothetical protein
MRVIADKRTALFRRLCDDLKRYVSPSEVNQLTTGSIRKFHANASMEVVAARQILNSFYKKLQDDIEDSADSAAISLFLNVNKRCGSWTYEGNTSWDDLLIGELKKSIYQFWNPTPTEPLCSSFEEFWALGRCGPGASLKATGCDFYSKLFSSPLTCTSVGLSRSYSNYIRNFPEWANAEFIRSAHFGEACIVNASKLMTVPKKRDISRTICVEPTLNMFAQLGFGALLERRLFSRFGIDLATQPNINRELARIGSLDGSFSTIDLSSASDSLSLRMLEFVLPRDFLAWLKLLRSPNVIIPSKEHVALNMVSTMGNGFTFPLQTMLFACIVEACLRARGFSPRRCDTVFRNFAVFGDDILLPSGVHYYANSTGKYCDVYNDDIRRDVYRLLGLLGFEINTSKSFFEGPFRESCGADYYEGSDVRGVYIRSLRTQESRYVAINRLQKWSHKVGIPLPSTLRFLLESVRFLPVPPWENDDAGVQVPLSSLLHVKLDPHLQSIKYRRRVKRSRHMTIGEGAILNSKGQTIYNVSGLFLSFLTGCVRDFKIQYRASDKEPYRTVSSIAPSW